VRHLQPEHYRRGDEGWVRGMKELLWLAWVAGWCILASYAYEMWSAWKEKAREEKLRRKFQAMKDGTWKQDS